MAKRTVLIERPAKLSCNNNQLRIETHEHDLVTIPIEDLWVLIVENHRTTITATLMAALSSEGVGLIVCGRNHMPNGLMLPLGAHSRYAAIVEDQLLMSKPLRKQLWRRIVETKIRNQATCLDLLGLPNADKLRAMAKKVTSGDTTNRESVAAAEYFRTCLPEGGRRNSTATALLDYGYSVLRGGIGRAAVSGGWLVSRGIHHDNKLNAFNLVDDLIEPFRPVVDLLVMQKVADHQLDANAKHNLVRVFEHCVIIGNECQSVQSAITTELASLREAVLDKNASRLMLPQLIPLTTVKVERG